MVTTRTSRNYTAYALDSFFKNTSIDDSEFYLIDNDDDFDRNLLNRYPLVQILRNQHPRSFAANVNEVMRLAETKHADLFFLNNDLVFTPDWLGPMLIERPALLSPFSNREIRYKHGNFTCNAVMSLSDYVGNEAALIKIVRKHQSMAKGTTSVLAFPFFCTKIPWEVYTRLGPLDEGFGKGGGEDDDYCLRAHLAGFSVLYANSSYLLHFIGKSTWSGAETKQETKIRCTNFRRRFLEKWGPDLLRLLVDHDSTVIQRSPEILRRLQSADFKGMITGLKQTR